MKLKKTLSGVLAAAMVVSLTPAMAFATSTNTVAKTPTVATDEKIGYDTDIALEIKNTDWGTAEQHIKLTLGNAEWVTNPVVGSGAGTKETITYTVGGAGKTGDKIVIEGKTINLDADKTNAQVATLISDALKDTGSTVDGAVWNKTGIAVTGTGNNVVTVESLTIGDKTDLGGATLNLVSDSTLTVTRTVTDGTAAGSPVIQLEESGDNGTGGPLDNSDSDRTAREGFIDPIKVFSATDNSVEIAFSPVAGVAKNIITLRIPTNSIKTLTEDGPVTVAIDGLDSSVSSSTLTIATAGSSTTTAVVNNDPKTFGRTTISSDAIKTSIEIRETAVNSIKKGGTYSFELRLPKGVTWNEAGTSIVGSLAQSYALSADGRYLTVSFVASKAANADSTRDVMTILPSIIIGKDASEGEIAVSLTGKTAPSGYDAVSDASDLIIAKYGEEAVAVSTVEAVPTVYPGYLEDKNDKAFNLYVTLKENMPAALLEGKFVDFDLPEEVQICGPISVSNKAGDNGTFSPSNTTMITIGENDLANASDSFTKTSKTTVSLAGDQDSSSFTFCVPAKNAPVGGNTWDGNKGNTVTFKIPVTVKANYEGDITLNVSGSKAGVDETDIVIGTVSPVVSVETTTTEVKNGVQKQAVANITITENITGYIDDKTTLTLTLDDLGLTNALVFDDAEAKVTAGDMEIGKISVDDGIISIPVKNASTKVSTIEVSAITATLNRTLPEGGYDLKVGGSALVENALYDDKDFTGTAVKVKDYLKIVTPAESVTVSEKVDAKFVIGEASYTNNGTATEMDAAAYIDSHNRTMVPIRYVANACGISENDIRWEAGSQTAIINGLNTVVTVKMGSNKLQTSTGEITMDTVAVNNNGRIYVPVRYIANALGANVSWDAATKTVTLTK